MGFGIRRFLSFRLRKRIRRRAENGLCVILESAPGKHQIDDISVSGLSYYYLDGGIRPKSGAYGLKVVSSSPTHSLRLTGKTISDRETGELVSQQQKIKRRSVRFQTMNKDQKKTLKKIIKRHTVGRRII
jgi:hypothetical protein